MSLDNNNVTKMKFKMNRNNFFKTILIATMFASIAISAQSDTTRQNTQAVNVITTEIELQTEYEH